MIEFQATVRKRLEESASDIGLESLCAMVSNYFLLQKLWIYFIIYLLQLHSAKFDVPR
jgi:hypothetical protein